KFRNLNLGLADFSFLQAALYLRRQDGDQTAQDYEYDHNLKKRHTFIIANHFSPPKTCILKLSAQARQLEHGNHDGEDDHADNATHHDDHDGLHQRRQTVYRIFNLKIISFADLKEHVLQVTG